MASVGKHFPGHGFVAADSHTDIPVDSRTLAQVADDDLVPFGALVKRGLEAVMPAHVVYPEVDSRPAGYSRRWLLEILRGRLGFDGLVFSDDLGMAGAGMADEPSGGDLVARAEASVAAGCDMVLACNDFAAADDLLARWRPAPNPDLARRTKAMEGRFDVQAEARRTVGRPSVGRASTRSRISVAESEPPERQQRVDYGSGVHPECRPHRSVRYPEARRSPFGQKRKCELVLFSGQSPIEGG